MRYRFGTLLGLALALVTVLASEADAGSRHRGSAAKLHQRGEPFAISGSCTGLMADEIRVDGTSYRLDPDARIYEVGRGFVQPGSFFGNRIVSLAGVKVRGTVMVSSVLIRPDFNPAPNARWNSPVGIKEESSPK
jgi:hypothetical protein